MICGARRSRVWFGAAVALQLVLSFLGLVAAPSSEARSGSDLRVALLQDVDSLNPFLGISSSVVQIFGLTYDRLTEYRTSDNLPTPGLATKWQTAPDKKTWTFTIRAGVRWSDGRPLTSADVAFTYNTIMKNPASVNSSQVKTFESVTAPDPGTVVIRTKVPTSTMLALDIPIVPAHVWQQLDPMKEPQGDPGRLVGSGPFRLAEASPGQQYRLSRNPDHWGGPAAMEAVVFRYFANTDAAAQALRKGEVDVVGNLTPAQFDALAKDTSVSTNEARGTRYTDLVFNTGAARSDGTAIGDGHPALKDQQVRAAIEHAINRRTLVDRVLAGHGVVGEAFFPPSYSPWTWRPGPGVRRDFDPATANRLLDSGGYRRGSDGVRRMPTGGPGAGRALVFRLYAPVERAHYGQSAIYLKQWLQEIGIRIETTGMADSQLGDRVAAGSFDLFLGGWLLDPDPDFQLSIQTCAARPDAQGNGSSNGFTCDRTVDALYRQQAESIVPAERVRIVHAIQQRIYEIAPQIILYYPGTLEAYRNDRVENLQRRPSASGSVVGAWSYRVARPAEAQDRTGGSPVWQLWFGALAGIVVLAAVLAFVRHRRGANDPSE